MPVFNAKHKKFGTHEIFHLFVMVKLSFFIVMYFLWRRCRYKNNSGGCAGKKKNPAQPLLYMFTCHGGKICDAAKPWKNAVITTGTVTLVQFNILNSDPNVVVTSSVFGSSIVSSLNFFGCDIVEGFHGKRLEFAVFDGDDFYFDFIADRQDCGWMFDLFGADLGDVDEAGEAVSGRLMKAPYGCRPQQFFPVTRPTSTLGIFSLRSLSAFS